MSGGPREIKVIVQIEESGKRQTSPEEIKARRELEGEMDPMDIARGEKVTDAEVSQRVLQDWLDEAKDAGWRD